MVDIVQYLHSGQKTGNLRFEAPEGEIVEIFFHKGQCVRVTKPGLTNIGDLLLEKGQVKTEELQKALKKQSESSSPKPLGQILEEMGFVTHDMVRDAVIYQIEEAIYELLGWEEGRFEFIFSKTAVSDDISVTLGDLVLPEEVNSVSVLLDAVRRFDETKRGKPIYLGNGLKPLSTPELETPKNEMEAPLENIGSDLEITFSLLKGMLLDAKKLDQNQNIVHRFLNVLSEHVERAILFMVQKESIRGVGGFGNCANGESINKLAKRLKIPLTKDSCLYANVHERKTYQGPAPKEKWLRTLYENMGPPNQNHIAILPVGGIRSVTSLVYGDNGKKRYPVQYLNLLEMAAAQTGVIMENAYLRNHLRNLKSRSGIHRN